MDRYVICGIHTDSGKSVSSVLMYQLLTNKNGVPPQIVKPLQTGVYTDTDFYKKMNVMQRDIKNFYTFKLPISPHLACKIEKKTIDYDYILKSSQDLLELKNKSFIFELAGGVYSPINNKKYMIDLIEDLAIPVILIVNDYIGSINHTILTIEALKKRKVDIKGIIYNRTEKGSSCSDDIFQTIISTTDIPKIGEINYISNIERILSDEKERSLLISDWFIK